MRRTLSILSMLCLVAFMAVGCSAAEEAADVADDAKDAVEEVVDDAADAVDDAADKAEDVVEDVVETVEDVVSGTDVMAFEAAEPGGTLVIGQQQEPDTLYTYGGSMLAGTHILNSIYDGPIEGLNYDYQAVTIKDLPKLENGGAEMAMVSVEAGDQYVDAETQEVVTATETVTELPQLTVTFELVDGLTWQDGTPVTAGDSVFSRELSCHPDTPSSKYTCDRTTSYEAAGDSTVVWTGLPGFTDQTYFTNFYTPLPQHQPGADGTLMSDMEPTAILEDENLTRKPYSFGPFMVEEWVTGESITLVKNENYWRAGEGLPFLDKVVHQFIPDTNALLAALRSGEIDVGTQGGLNLDQYDELVTAEEDGEMNVYYVVGTVWEHIDFDLNPVDDRAAFGACKEVRQAVAYGTDRQSMVDQIMKGQTKVQNTYVPDSHWAYPADGAGLSIYDYNPDMAGELLDGLGFVDADGDGIREAQEDITCTITTDVDGSTKDQVIPAGTPLELTLNTTSGNEMRQQSTLLFQSNMNEIGVGINLEYLEAGTYFSDGPDGPLFGRRFDLGQFAWLTGVQPPVGLYWCTEVPSEENAWAGQNETGWCNPDYDKISKQADNTLERAEALPLYQQAQEMFTENLPVMPLFARVKVMGTSPDVVNFAPNPTVNSETWNIETWGFASN